jgi:hypothetical protein
MVLREFDAQLKIFDRGFVSRLGLHYDISVTESFVLKLRRSRIAQSGAKGGIGLIRESSPEKCHRTPRAPL